MIGAPVSGDASCLQAGASTARVHLVVFIFPSPSATPPLPKTCPASEKSECPEGCQCRRQACPDTPSPCCATWFAQGPHCREGSEDAHWGGGGTQPARPMLRTLFA